MARAGRSSRIGHEKVGHRTKSELTEAAREKMERGYAPTTAAGEFVHEEIHHVRQGTHGAKNPKQAVAIGLSKARRAGVPLGPRPVRKRD